MMQFYAGFLPMEKFYFACACFGGFLFILRTLMMFMGHSSDADAGMDASEVHGDADASFKILSLQGLTAFFMMFGLVALAMSRQSGLSHLWSVLGGLVAGLATVWLIGRIFVSMKRLQADGTLNIQNAVGQSGEVYLTIHPGKSGQVRVSVQGQLRIFDAVGDDDFELKTGMRIKVVGVSGGSSLIVAKA
ncbi:MAG: hypothetical protein V2A34_16625 [Lentisphaerota bacterium]